MLDDLKTLFIKKKINSNPLNFIQNNMNFIYYRYKLNFYYKKFYQILTIKKKINFR